MGVLGITSESNSEFITRLENYILRQAYEVSRKSPAVTDVTLNLKIKFKIDKIDKELGEFIDIHKGGETEKEWPSAGIKYMGIRSDTPPIQTVHISDTEQEIVRIAVVQFCFELTELFPFAAKNKDEVKTKIFSALDIARDDGVNIVCLPELCLCEEWISAIRGKYPDMIVIGGSFYKDNKNICPVIMRSDVEIHYQHKVTASDRERGLMEQRLMIPGVPIYRYETRFGRFVILICRDFGNFVNLFEVTDIDMIFCPSFNVANKRVCKKADAHVEETPSYILIANTGIYGGTSIFGRSKTEYLGGLVDGGCRDAEDLTYMLCKVKKKQEKMIIADFNLVHKSVQVPTSFDTEKEIRSVDNIKMMDLQGNRPKGIKGYKF